MSADPAPIATESHSNSLGFESLARRSLPSGLAFAGGQIVNAQEPLYPHEDYAVRYAVSSRRAAFRAGRTYARTALHAIGVSHREISMGANGLPIWPAGIVGSISHDDTLCAAAIGKREQFASVGIDIEPAARLDSDLVGFVCDPKEIKQRAIVEAQLDLDLPKLVFSAKESTYKAYFPLAGQFLDFHDVSVEICARSQTFLASFVSGRHVVAEVGRTIQGGFFMHDARLITYALVPTRAL